MDLLIEPKFEAYSKLLLKYNQTHNISGAKNLEEVRKNLEDNIYPINFIDSFGEKVLDIGSGAGFPAIPLAISLPNTQFFLFEPIAKKSAFLHLVKMELNLSNVKVETKRVEDGPFFTASTILSRAVGSIELLLNLSKEYIGKETQILLYKGSSVQNELENLKGAKIYSRKNRHYVLMRKLNGF